VKRLLKLNKQSTTELFVRNGFFRILSGFFFGKRDENVSDETYLIAGLGNPGSKYEGTRHNVGFQVVEALARRYGTSLTTDKWDALHCRITIAGKRVYLVKPQSFMNRSGVPLAHFAQFFKIPVDCLLVIHDDLDMSPGRIKVVATGGAGGHNGIRSVIQCLGTKDFHRLKVGIGRPGQNNIHSDIPVERFVLSSLSNDEQRLLDERMDRLLDGIEDFLASGGQKAMNALNGIT
jgi:PTH1 family peptidyl-tRNA hydrolase